MVDGQRVQGSSDAYQGLMCVVIERSIGSVCDEICLGGFYLGKRNGFSGKEV